MRRHGGHEFRRILVVVAKQVLVFILVHVTSYDETKIEGEGGICRGDGRGVGRCSCGPIEGFQRVNYAWDCNL